MGSVSPREVLLKCYPPRKSKVYPKWNIKSISSPNRLVCNQLCEEIQRSVFDKKSEACNCVSVIQVSSESLQQKDV